MPQNEYIDRFFCYLLFINHNDKYITGCLVIRASDVLKITFLPKIGLCRVTSGRYHDVG